MTRTLKFPAKIALSLCTLFCLWPCFAFSEDVDTAWVRRYNGPGNGDDKAVAIAVDSGGNVYVTGSSFDSTTGYDYCTIKYLPNGDTGWVRRYNGLASKDDFASALVLDGGGNVYITGRSNGNFATIKYGPAGNQLWVKTLPDILVYANQGAYDLALDNDGNVYVTGVIWDGEASTCWGTVKYDSTGNQLWFRNFYTGRIAVAIAVDTGGNAYVTGYGYGPNLADYLTVKYYPDGDTAWVRRYNGPNNGNDFANAIAVGSSGNVYVTGSQSGVYATIKYDSSGNQIWIRRFANIFTVPDDGAFALALDSGENVYVTGRARGDEIEDCCVTIKYDSLGNQLWIYRCGGDAGIAIVPDRSTNAYVAGYGYFSLYSPDYIIEKYNTDGTQLWRKYYSGLGVGDDKVNALTIDVGGNLYVTGHSQGIGTSFDFATVKYSLLPELKGDLNLDGSLSTTDVVLMLNCAFAGEAPPAAPSACDINCDGKISATDVVILLNMVFATAPAPC